MELDANTRYEIKAAAFERMEGMLAPGKDQREGPPYEERCRKWDEWCAANQDIVAAFMGAIQRVL